MIVELRLPRLNPNMSHALIETLHQNPGKELKAGEKLLDLSVMLGAAFAQDCPPLSYYRLVLRERVWLREVLVAEGTSCEADTPIALFSTEAEEPLDAAPGRALRCASASIMFNPAMFSGRAQ